MIATRPAAGLAVLLAAAAAGLAIGSTGRLDDLSGAVVQEARSLEGLPDRPSVKTRRLLLRVDGILDRLPPDAGTPVELKAASKAAGLVERRLAAVGDLVSLAGQARDGYAGEIAVRRDALAGLVEAGALAGPALRKATKRLAAADRFLERAGAATVLKKAFRLLGRAAAQVEVLPGEGGDLSATWVIDSFGFAPPGVGYDFDHDGTPNNALGAMFQLLSGLGGGSAPGAAIQAALDDGSLILVLDIWDVADWNGDPVVSAGALPGLDLDGDPSDNFSGSEPLAAGAPTGPDGHPLLRGTTSLGAGGGYEVTIPLSTLPVGLGDLPLAGPVVLQGAASPSSNTGILAFAMTPAAAVELAVAANPSQEATIRSFAGLLAALADVDTDGNGGKDALSGAMLFTSVPCTLVQP